MRARACAALIYVRVLVTRAGNAAVKRDLYTGPGTAHTPRLFAFVVSLSLDTLRFSHCVIYREGLDFYSLYLF